MCWIWVVWLCVWLFGMCVICWVFRISFVYVFCWWFFVYILWVVCEICCSVWCWMVVCWVMCSSCCIGLCVLDLWFLCSCFVGECFIDWLCLYVWVILLWFVWFVFCCWWDRWFCWCLVWMKFCVCVGFSVGCEIWWYVMWWLMIMW